MSLVTNSPLIAHYPAGPFVPGRTADKRGLPNRFEPIGQTAAVDSPFTNNLPIDQPENVVGANLTTSYSTDFYERVHVVPVAVDVGNLLNDVSRDIEVFNAYRDSTRTLNDILVTGDSTGLTLNQPTPTPATFQKLESKIYQLDVSTDGPPSIAAVYTFDFDTEDPTLQVVGSRLINFTFEPDWSDPVVETLDWRTNILESEGGLEQRIQIRQTPRKTIEYRVLVNDNNKRLLETYLWGWRSRKFGLPLWNECTLLNNTLTFGSSIINIDTDYKQFTAGGNAVLMTDPFTFEAVTIESVSPTQLVLSQPTTLTWGPETRVYPLVVAQILETPQISQPTVHITYMNIRFTVFDNEPIEAVDFPITYDGLSVLTEEPDRSTDGASSYENKVDFLDFGTGVTELLDRSGFSDQVTKHTWLFQDKQKAWEWKQFFHYRRGRLKRFRMPSWSSDFELLESITFNDTAIVVKDVQYRRFYNLDPAKRDIRFIIADGTILVRRITGVAVGNPGEEILTIDAPLGTTYSVGDIYRIEYLHPVRLNSDTVQLLWHTQDILQVDVNTRVVTQ